MPITPLMPVYPRCGFRPVRGEGCYLHGEDGTKALDFAAGIAVNALGHGHPKLTKAIADQAATLMHVSNLYGSPQGEALAQRIVDNSFADTVFFTNSGVEAIECAIKTARRYHFVNGNPERHTLITFKNAFHGRSLGAISATDQAKMRDGFEQMIPNHDHLFEEIRGKGLMLGIKLKEPAVSRDFVAHLRDNHGLLTVAAGENVFRVLPPLIIDESHIGECIERLSEGARSFAPPSDD